MMSAETRQDALERIEEDVLKLRERSVSWRRDQHDIKAKWKLYYVVDPDLVIMYLDPLNNLRYAEVFGADDEGTKSALTYLLADFLFLDRQGNCDESAPAEYWLVPPHDEELKGQILRITRNASKAFENAQLNYLEIFSMMEEFLNAGDQQVDLRLAGSIERNTDKFIKAANAIKNLARVQERLQELRGKIRNIWNAKIDTRYLIDETETEVDTNSSTMYADWHKRISDARIGQPKHDANARDAKVLATIEYLNTKLIQKKVCAKVILVTGATTILKAGKEFPWLLDPASSNKQTDFAKEFMRHHHWAMASRCFFEINSDSKESSPAASLARWSETLFPESDQEPVKPQSGNAEALNEIPIDWSKAVLSLATARYGREAANLVSLGDSTEEIQHLKDHSSSPKDYREKLEGLVAKVESQMTDSFSRLYKSSAWLSIAQSQSEVGKHIRMAPALVIDDSFKQYDEYYKDMLSLVSGDQNAEQRDKRLEDLKKLSATVESIEGDPSLYHSHVIHAAVHAAMSLWEPAIALCDIALKIADDKLKADSTENEKRRGREAAYLAAVCARISARTEADLGRAGKYLQQAIERRDPSDIAIDPNCENELRFICEGIVIGLRKAYFQYLSILRSVPEQATPQELARLNLTINVEYNKLVTFFRRLPMPDKEQKNYEVLIWVRWQSLTNILKRAVFMYFESEFVGTSINRKNEMQGKFRDEINELRQLIESQSKFAGLDANPVYQVASLIFAPPEGGARKLAMINRALKIVQGMTGTSSYDKNHKFILKTILEKLQSTMRIF
jgi:hypothetical protein